MMHAREALTEKVLVSQDTKLGLTRIKMPGERYGDVIARLVQAQKRSEFIAHLDAVARAGDFVPLDNDPEYAEIKREASRAGNHRSKGTPVR